MRITRHLSAAIVLAGAALQGAEPAGPQAAAPLVPWPRTVRSSPGRLTQGPAGRIVAADAKLAPLAKVLSDEIQALAGVRLAAAEGPARAGDIILALADRLAGEAYELDVSDRAVVCGGTYRAVAWGTATLLQSLQTDGGTLALPRLSVADRPEYAYRGLLIDVARQPHPIETLRQIVELCRLYKINYLQLHLTDGEAFAFASRAWPQLTTKNWNGVKAYTRAELDELVRFADERGVTLVPELETPGHSGAAERTMPEVFQSVDPNTHKPVGLGMMNLANPRLYEVLDTLIGELCEVFRSSPYVHIGCDEVWLARVSKTPEAQAHMRARGLAGAYEMYLDHIVRMNELVKKRGRRTIVWEGFHNDGSAKIKIPRDIIVMPFENTYNPANNLAKLGYTMINTAWTPIYITRGVRQDPRHIYEWDIHELGLFTRDYAETRWVKLAPTPLMMGAQMCAWEQPAWAEVLSLRKRLPAMSERIWHPQAGRDYADFERRFAATDAVLARLILPVTISAEGLMFSDGRAVDDLPGGPDRQLFADRLAVRLSPVRPLRSGEAIHYTLDGGEPTADSPVYSGPVEIDGAKVKLVDDNRTRKRAEVTVKARLFAAGRAVGYTRTQFYRYHWVGRLPRRLRCRLYEVGKDTRKMPADTTGLKCVHDALEPWADLNGMPHVGRPRFFAAEWRGRVRIAAGGDYEFKLRSQGGTSQLFLDGKCVCDRNETDWGETLGRARLAEGLHDVRLNYCGQGSYLSLAWRRPGEKDWPRGNDLESLLVEIKGD